LYNADILGCAGSGAACYANYSSSLHPVSFSCKFKNGPAAILKRVSLPPNPWSEPGPPLIPEQPAPVADTASENPVWSGWDVLQIVFLTVAAVAVFLPVVAVAAQRLLYPKDAFLEVVTYPVVTVLGQGLAYLVILGFMVAIVKREPGRDFLQAIRWNWPNNWSAYLLAGVALSFTLQGIAHFLPIPKEVPMDRFFRTASEAWALSLFGVTFAPLLEELFFRGFLFPVLVRRFGIAIGVLATAAAFSLIHAPQLGRAWGPVLVIFMVGLALTLTRAITKSVAASLIMHMAYNGTLSVLLFVGTDGFRHLERLNQ
jgi:membrane protease YdiL (CAAX protease family)